MAEKRRDSKGRILKDNEYQRKDGKYEYKYFWGTERKSVYSWTLVPTDKTPDGKRPDICLRDKIKAIERDLRDGINSSKANMTLNQLFDCYMENKTDLRDNTRENYVMLWNNKVRSSKLGNMKVCQIKQMHIKSFYVGLSKEGAAAATVKKYHNMINPALEMAVDSDIIRKNPAKGAQRGIGGSKTEKEALTVREQEILLDFVKGSGTYNVYYPMLSLALLTGLRVGELTGLTWKDIDQKKKVIRVRHQLQYLKIGSETKFLISPLKTDAGVRDIPITPDIQKCLTEQKKVMMLTGRRSNVEVDGYTDFLFITKNGTVFAPNAVNSFLKNIVDHYNKKEMDMTLWKGREPELLPHISSHILRHTACTRMAEQGMDVKVLQYIMGHSDISVTMNVYNHVDAARVESEMQKMIKFG